MRTPESTFEPIEVVSVKQAQNQARYGYEGVFTVPDAMLLNTLVNAMGDNYAFEYISQYNPQRASDYSNPNPNLGQLRDLRACFFERPGNGAPELSIAVSGLLRVSGRGVVAEINSSLSIRRFQAPKPGVYINDRFYTLQSDERRMTVLNEEALDMATYANIKPQAATLIDNVSIDELYDNAKYQAELHQLADIDDHIDRN